MNELESWLVLSRAPRVGPVSAQALVSYFGTAQSVVEANLTEKKESGLFHKTTLAYFKEEDFSAVQADLALQDAGVQIIYWGHEDYPPLLAQIEDSPLVLFVRGNVSLLSMPQLGIVGSRSADRSGLAIAHDFAQALSQGGLAVTSGLALGIDAAAHQGALEGTAGTVAVMGTGLDRVYPARNKSLAHQIAKSGALVSEFGAGMGPRAENFPRRNRIISGLSLGTLVVQAALRSGSLITARTAMEQDREVFAVPGSIHNPQAQGCHYLIKQGAKLVESAADIVDELSTMLAYSLASVTVAPSPDVSLTETEAALLHYIDYDPMLVDALLGESGWEITQLSADLLSLELAGKIEMLPGAKVQKII